MKKASTHVSLSCFPMILVRSGVGSWVVVFGVWFVVLNSRISDLFQPMGLNLPTMLMLITE